MEFKYKDEFEFDEIIVYPKFKDESKSIEEYKNIENTFISHFDSKKNVEAKTIRREYKKILQKIEKREIDKVNIELFETEKMSKGEVLREIIDVFSTFTYGFDKYKSNKKHKVKEVYFLKKNENEELNKIIEEEKILRESINIAKDLVNEPAFEITPNSLGKECEKYGKEYGFDVKVYDEKYIQKQGMGAFYAVGKGSINPPRLIIMKYLNGGDSEILGLVGKGVTYDSGGYSLKTGSGMMTMKSDMAGSASVIGTMIALAKSNVKANVIGIIAACENLIGDNSVKPGDIVKSMSGKTIEVLNTDAEGRLTLVDGIYYAIKKENVTKVIDVATLTGAVVAALGKEITGVFSNNDDFCNKYLKMSEISKEKAWRMPLEEEYKEKLKSNIADIKNIGDAYAGSITAALFIEEFVENTPWIHLDIAGTSFTESENLRSTCGATGTGIRTLYLMIKNK